MAEKKSPHFFHRESDGSVRIRLRFSPEEASRIEEAAGETPLVVYLHRVINDRAAYHVERARRNRTIEPPTDA